MTNLPNDNFDNDKKSPSIGAGELATTERNDCSTDKADQVAAAENTAPSDDVITLEEIGSHRHHHKHHSGGKSKKSRLSKHKNLELHVDSKGHTSYKKRKSSKKFTETKAFKIANRICITLLILILIILLGLFIYILVARQIGKNDLIKGNQEAKIEVADNATGTDDGRTVVYNGKTYTFNENLATIVIMGIDQSELDNEGGVAGRADAVYIFAYDTETGKCSLLPVNRDTMVDVKIRSVGGKDLGYKNLQLALSYSYGDGKETSCQNTLDALSKIFYNIPFSNYVALDWDAIAPLNDAIGGVTLTALEDVSTKYSTITKGQELTLMGMDAWSYVKYRNTSELKSNPLRISRQKQYISAYVDKLLPMARNDISIISELYNTAADYMCTNLSREDVVYIASEILPEVYSTKDINQYSIEGDIKAGEKFVEFTPDETSLYETILKVFYVQQ